MIVFLFILIAFIFTITARNHFRTYKNHYTIFNFWWGSTVFLSYLNLSELYIPRNETYLIFLFGLISFNFSIFFTKKIPNIINGNFEFKPSFYNDKLLIAILLLAIIFIYPYFFKGYLNSTTNINLAETKATLSDSLQNNPIEVIKIYYFTEPVIIFSLQILVIIVLFSKKVKVFTLALIIITLIMFSISFGGRIQMFRTVIFILIGLFFSNFVKKNEEIYNNRKKYLYILIIVLIVLMTLFTISRSWSGKGEFYKNFNIYFIGSFSLFDKFLKHPSLYGLSNEMLWGRATLGSIIDPFLLFLSKVFPQSGIKTNDLAANIINSKGEVFHIVGNGYKMNAFTTMYYVFYRDFNLIGVLIIPFFISMILNKILKKAILKKDNRMFIIYLFSCYLIIFGTNRWEALYFFPIGFICLSYLFIKKK
jgi:oligosaccharide repeat unit polymerase